MEDFLFEDEKIKIYNYLMLGIHSSMYVLIDRNSALVIDPNRREDALALLRGNNTKKSRNADFIGHPGFFFLP